MKIITVCNLKGGTGKTTTAAHLAHAYAASGRQVLVVDADPQGSALRWSEQGEWTIPTVALPVKTLHTKLDGIVPSGTGVVIIDTPPLDDQAGIVYSAMRAADHVVVTMAPTMMEFERLADVWAAIEEVEPLRSKPTSVSVLLNRTVPNANSTPMFRELIEESGHVVLSTTIPRRESIAQSFGAPVTDIAKYLDIITEIEKVEK